MDGFFISPDPSISISAPLSMFEVVFFVDSGRTISFSPSPLSIGYTIRAAYLCRKMISKRHAYHIIEVLKLDVAKMFKHVILLTFIFDLWQ